MVRRKKQLVIAKHFSKKEFTILIGPRQIGKSTMVKQMFNDLVTKGNIAYFLNLDRKDILDELNINPENLFKICPLQPDKKITVFIDEIQYLDDPTTFLKLLFDEYSSQLKIVATGSSAFYIDKQFKDSLVGRKKIFQMGTLDFEEFLHFKGRNDLVAEIALLKSKKKTKSINAEVVLVQPQMQALKTLEQEVAEKLLPERDFLMTHVLNKAPLTTVLQRMSEALPEGVWLEKLVVNNSGKERSFRVQGRAAKSQNKTDIEQIEDYLKKLQTAIPNAQFTYSTNKQVGEADLPSTAFDAEYEWLAD